MPYLLPGKIAVSPGWINLKSNGTELGGGERYFRNLERKAFIIGKAHRGFGWRLQVELIIDAIMSFGSFTISHHTDRNTERDVDGS